MLSTFPDSLMNSLFNLIDGIGLGDGEVQSDSLSLLICELAEIGNYSDENTFRLLNNLDALIA